MGKMRSNRDALARARRVLVRHRAHVNYKKYVVNVCVLLYTHKKNTHKIVTASLRDILIVFCVCVWSTAVENAWLFMCHVSVCCDCATDVLRSKPYKLLHAQLNQCQLKWRFTPFAVPLIMAFRPSTVSSSSSSSPSEFLCALPFLFSGRQPKIEARVRVPQSTTDLRKLFCGVFLRCCGARRAVVVVRRVIAP